MKDYIINMALFMALSLPLILIGRFIFHRITKCRLRELNWFHEIGVILLFVVMAGIASQTLWSGYFGSGYNWLLINLKPFNKIGEIKDMLGRGILSYIITEVIGNAVFFVPVGFLLPLLWKKQEKFWVVLVTCISASVFIELVQLLIPQRATDIDDVILNTIGACIGFCIYLLVKRLLGNRTDKFKSPKKIPQK